MATALVKIDWNKYDQDRFSDYDDAVGFGGAGMILTEEGIVCEKQMEADVQKMVDKFCERQDDLNQLYQE